MKLFKITYLNGYNEEGTTIESAKSRKLAITEFNNYAPECTLLKIERY